MLLVLLLSLYSCSASRITYEPAHDFNREIYENPVDYGYSLILDVEQSGQDSLDRSFIPISFEGGIRAIQKEVNYPDNALRRFIQGLVLLDVYIDTSNTVTNIDVIITPSNTLAKAAIRAVVNTKHYRAQKNGKMVPSFIRIPVQFKLYAVGVRRQVQY